MDGPKDDHPRQLPMQFKPVEARSHEDFVVTAANEAAANAVLAWPDWHSPVMLLAGPVGSGKTHLATIWRERCAAVCFDAAAIGEPALPPSKAAFVEDADGGNLDERGLFHLINTIQAAGGWLLLTSRSFPSAWNVGLADLASRLKTATTVEIGEPDDMLLVAVITKLFADRQITVDRHIVTYLVARMDRSLATAIDLVDRIDRMSLEQKKPVTRNLAASVLAGDGG